MARSSTGQQNLKADHPGDKRTRENLDFLEKKKQSTHLRRKTISDNNKEIFIKNINDGFPWLPVIQCDFNR